MGIVVDPGQDRLINEIYAWVAVDPRTQLECVFADVRSSKDALMYQAEAAVGSVLARSGPNASGEFHVRVSFWPDGNYATHARSTKEPS